MKSKINSTAFRQIMGCFATGVAVVTARNDALGAYGLTVNSLTSVSLDPPLVLFCLDKSAHLHPHFKRAESFAINILADGQEEISRHFASRHHHAAPKNMWEPNKKGGLKQDCPLLRSTLVWIMCKPHAFYKGGDHTIIVGEVTDLHKRAGAQEPLVYFHGRYRALEDLGNETSGARK